ncbi:MAG: hypothetical protein LAT63_05450 [Marinobacter sp.]|nr:hypothetical protein [Marinobacter sp.]
MIPLWFKLAYTAFVVVLVLVYLRGYGPRNFLWFSDIALIGAVPAMWLESSLLASMLTLAVLLPEVVWNTSFFGHLITRKKVLKLADYMFDPAEPRHLRALSLFHVPLPLVLLWMVVSYGYDDRALQAATLLAWLVLPLSWWLSPPKENINWVFGPLGKPQTLLPPGIYLGLLMLFFPLVIYWPTHHLLRWWLGS